MQFDCWVGGGMWTVVAFETVAVAESVWQDKVRWPDKAKNTSHMHRHPSARMVLRDLSVTRSVFVPSKMTFSSVVASVYCSVLINSVNQCFNHYLCSIMCPWQSVGCCCYLFCIIFDLLLWLKKKKAFIFTIHLANTIVFSVNMWSCSRQVVFLTGFDL